MFIHGQHCRGRRAVLQSRMLLLAVFRKHA
jgi:hypothetical protein